MIFQIFLVSKIQCLLTECLLFLIQTKIKKSTFNIKDISTYFKETQNILQLLRKEKIICEIHHQFSQIPENCDPQEIGCFNKNIGCLS